MTNATDVGRELCATCGMTFAAHVGNTGVVNPCWTPSGRYQDAGSVPRDRVDAHAEREREEYSQAMISALQRDLVAHVKKLQLLAETRWRSGVYADILAERKRQDAQWGGPEHDDANLPRDWFMSRLACEKRYIGATEDSHARRAALVKLAALVVAEIESIDRKGAT